MDDALQAYDAGRVDGSAGRQDTGRAEAPDTGADYLVGVADGQMAAFEASLIAAVHRALDGKNLDGKNPDGGNLDGGNEAR